MCLGGGEGRRVGLCGSAVVSVLVFPLGHLLALRLLLDITHHSRPCVPDPTLASPTRSPQTEDAEKGTY